MNLFPVLQSIAEDMPNQHKKTPSYIFFYILFSVDTWRIVLGILFSVLLTPQLLKSSELSPSGIMMLYIMMTAIGWAVASYPAKKIAFFLRKMILKENLPH